MKAIESPFFTKNTAEEVNQLDSKGILGWCVFQCTDIYATYEELKSKDAKVLIFVHGGGWLCGDKKQYREMATNLADNGLTVVLINYRLSPTVKFPSHIADVTSVIHWAKSFIATYKGNKENIYLMGHSAGGHITSLLLFDKTYLENNIDTTTKTKISPFLISWGNEENKLVVNESLNFINELKDNEIKFQSFTFDVKNHYAFKDDWMDAKSGFYKALMQFIS